MPRFERRVPGTPSRVGINPFTRERVEFPGQPASQFVVEVERQGLDLVTTTTRPEKKPKTKRELFSSEEAARGALARAIRKLLRRGYIETKPAAPRAPSALLVEELLTEGSPLFLEEVSLFTGKKLASIAERWSEDTRPAMRAMLLDYVRKGCDRPGQKLLVKRLFLLAEKRGDDELVALFAMAFDRLEKRWLIEQESYDYREREHTKERRLIPSPFLRARVPRNDSGVFSRYTREYLCRRAFRYLRGIAYRDPKRYVRVVAPAIAELTDEDLGEPARFLDAWSLIHVLYWGSSVLVRAPRGARVAEGRTLAELEFAPLKPEAWAASFDIVIDLAATARSRPVARFAVHLLEAHFTAKLDALQFAAAKRLLGAAHEETRAFMVLRLDRVSDLGKQPVSEWLALVDSGTLETLPGIVRLFREHVAPRRLTLEECVTLALAPAAPVAELGLAWVKERAGAGLGTLERQRLLRLVSARAPLVRKEAASYLADLIAKAPESKPEEVRELLDAGDADVRARAMSLLESERFSKSPVLWASMAESPHADVREKLLGALFTAANENPPAVHPRGPNVDDAALARLWSTTLLSIHRGGRAKPKALVTMAAELVRDPTRAEAIVPLMRIALRSVRPAERRPALAAIARAAQAHVEVRVAVGRHLPELELGRIDVEVIA